MAELGCIRRDVPPEVMAATACPAGTISFFSTRTDARTGDSLDQLPDGVVITHVELWDESPEHKEPGEELAEEPEDEDDDEPGKPFPDPRPAIMGPTTTTG